MRKACVAELYRLICIVYGGEGPDVEFKVRLMSQ